MNAFCRVRPASEPAPSADQRRARNLDYCEYLIERGMVLARAASERAQDDIAAPPKVARIPGSAAAEIDQWKEEARRRGPDYGKLFTHLSRAIRQTMLLEMYLAEGHTPSPPSETQTARPHPANDSPAPRPHKDPLRRETLERMDCVLPIGPDGEIQVEDLLLQLAQDLGMPQTPTATPAPQNPTTKPPHPSTPAPAPIPQTAAQPAPAKPAPHHTNRRW